MYLCVGLLGHQWRTTSATIPPNHYAPKGTLFCYSFHDYLSLILVCISSEMKTETFVCVLLLSTHVRI